MMIAPSTWAAAARADPPDTPATIGEPPDALDDIVLLRFEPAPPRQFDWPRVAIIAIAAVVTIALAVGWRVAEIRIVDRDPWQGWDAVWIACAAGTILALIGWAVAGAKWYRRRQAGG